MPELKDLVEYTGYTIAGNGRKASIESVFNAIRQSGVEVDLQTVSHLYEDVFDLNNEAFSTQEEVANARAQTFRVIQNKRGQKITKNEIGKDSPVTAVAAQMANMLSQDLQDQPTIQKLMQDRLAKAAKKVMQIKGKKLEGQTTEEIIREVLLLENNNPYYAFGMMDNAETLFKNFQLEFSSLASVAGDHYQNANIQQYADIMEKAAYHFLMSTAEMDKVIKDTLTEAGFSKEITVKDETKVVVDWNKVVKTDIDFRNTIRNVFAKKGFSESEVKRIADELENKYRELVEQKAAIKLQTVIDRNDDEKSKRGDGKNAIENLLDIYKAENFTDDQQDQLLDLLGVDKGVKKILLESLVDAGLFKEVKKGDETKKVVDWTKVFSGKPVNIKDILEKRLQDQQFTVAQSVNISDAMQQNFDKILNERRDKELARRNKEADRKRPVNQKPAIDKLLSLYNLGVFNNTAQQALFKVLGVSSATQNQAAQLGQLMQQYNSMAQLPMSKWSPTYIKTIQREIENIIENIEEQDWKIKAVRLWGFYQQLSGGLILSNLQNITENTTSGLVEYLLTLIQNPRQALQSAKIFANVFVDVISGGVREGRELSNVFNTSGNLEDRFNFETAKTIRGKISAFFSAITRVFLSSFDNAYKAAMSHSLELSTIRKVLAKQGVSKHDAAIIVNEMYYGNRVKVESIAKQLQDSLVSMGVNSAKGKWRRMAAEISEANLLSDGQFFKDTLASLESSGKVTTGTNAKLNEDLIKAVRNASESTAGKGLGHESDTKLFQQLDAIGQSLSSKVDEARKSGNKKELLQSELMRNGYGMVNRFRSGAMRWLWLSFEKSSGIALLQTLITDVAFNKGKTLNFDNINLNHDDPFETEQELARYLALRQRLVRESVTPVVSYIVGMQVILPLLLSAFGYAGDGDDDDEKDKLAQIAKWLQEDNGRKRWFQKLLPQLTYNYLTAQTYTSYGEVKVRENPTEPSWKNMFDAEVALQGGINNYNSSPIFKLITEVQTQLSKGEKGNISVPFGSFVGNFLNLGGPLKAYDINKNAVKALMLEPTKLTKEEWKEIKPQDFWEAFYYNSLNQDLYKNTVKKPSE